MLTIQKDQDLFTMIIFIDVDPEDQRQILDINIEDTEDIFTHKPGMVAAAFYKSLDGERVTELVFWESEEHLQEALQLDEISDHIAKIREISNGDEVSAYKLRYVDTAAEGSASDAITVSDNAGLLAVVNKFQVEPESRDALLDVLIKDHESHLKHLSGFVSVGYLVSPDDTKVLEHLQFESKEAFEAHKDNPEKLAHEDKIAKLVDSSETDLYEVEYISYGVNHNGGE